MLYFEKLAYCEMYVTAHPKCKVLKLHNRFEANCSGKEPFLL